MATRYDYYDAGGDTDRTCTTTTWWAQKITPSSSYSASYITLRVKRSSTVSPSGTCTASLRTTTGAPNYNPTGTILDSGDVNIADIGTTYSLITFTFSAPVSLTSGTTYAIVLKRNDAVWGGNVSWLDDTDGSGGGYDGTVLSACATFTTNSGSTWSTTLTAQDMLFEVWDASSLPTVGDLSAAASIIADVFIDFLFPSGALSASASITAAPEVVGSFNPAGALSAAASITATAIATLLPQTAYKRLVAVGTNNSGTGKFYYEDI